MKVKPPSDLEMVTNVGSWPNWPYLPMKRRSKTGRMPECGILMVVGEDPLKFRFAKDLSLFHMTTEKLQAAVDVDPQQLFVEGWEID